MPLFFLLGLALAFTPCVLPMLPIVSGIVVGSQAPPRRAFARSMAFVLPMALTYAALGVAAALAGANLQAVLKNRWTMLALGAVYIVLALGMFGVFTLQLPAQVLGAAGGAVGPWRPLTFAAASATAPAQAATGLRFEPIASEPELQARLAAARAAGQATLAEFYADWCVSCKVIEKEVFGDPRVQRSLAGVLLLRADVTANDARHRELMRTHQVVGPPTVMMVDAAARERREARLVGEFTADQFLQRWAGGPEQGL